MIKINSFIILMLASIYAHATQMSGTVTIKNPNFFFGSSSTVTGDIDLPNNTLTFNTFTIYGVAANATTVELLQPGTYTRTHTLSSGATISRTGVIPAGTIGAYLVISSNSAEYQIYSAWTISANNTTFTNVAIPENMLIGDSFALSGSNVRINFATPTPSINVSIDVPDGDTQECSQHDGRNVAMNATAILGGATTVLDSINWELDDAPISQGANITLLIPFGTHTVTATGVTTSGLSHSDSTIINIVDTTRPSINITFTDDLGNVVTTASNGDFQINLNANDICDPQPTITGGSAAPVMNVINDDIISINGATNNVQLPTTAVQVTATAADASGNSISGQNILNIQ